MEKLIMVSEAAETMGVTPESLRLYIRNGSFPGLVVKEGRARPKYRIFQADVDKYMKVGEGDPTNPHSIFNNEIEFKRIESQFSHTNSQISELRVAVFKGLDVDNRQNLVEKIKTLSNNQSELFRMLNEILKVISELPTKEMLQSQVSLPVSDTTVPKPTINPLAKFGGK